MSVTGTVNNLDQTWYNRMSPKKNFSEKINVRHLELGYNQIHQNFKF